MARNDPGEFDYWLAGELVGTPPNWKDGGEFDYWAGGGEGGELPTPPAGGLPEPLQQGKYKNIPTLGAG